VNLLIFKVNHLGDNVVFLPVVQELRRRFPIWKIMVITTPRESELYRGLLPTAQILAGDEKSRYDYCWKRPWELAHWLWRVRQARPDACLVSFDQGNVSHFLTKYSGARVRVGGNLRYIRFSGTLTHEVPKPDNEKVPEWNWLMGRALVQAVAPAQAPSWPNYPPVPTLDHLYQPAVINPRRIVVHAGARDAPRQWGLDRAAELAARLSATYEVLWIDRPETRAVSLAPAVRRVYTATLGELLALLSSAALVFCNNSGPMHLASVLGRPTVVVSGASAWGWDPYWYSERFRLLRMPGLACLPCERPDFGVSSCANLEHPMACMRYWTAEAVEHICREWLDRWR